VLTISIDTAKEAYQFDWYATSEEFHRLYDDVEEAAANEGLDPMDIATVAIHLIATKGMPSDAVRQRDQANSIIYAVLRFAADNLDLSKMVDHAGVIVGTPTIFDLAEHQHMTAKIRVGSKNAFLIELAGRSRLDS
jgi:hypothetical protein